MESAIIYKSKTGFTKQYAIWIQEETGFELLEYNLVSKNVLASYELVIYGGRVHAGKVDGLNKIREMVNKNAKFIVFATGATPMESKETIDSMWNANFTKEEIDRIPHYYFQAGLNYEAMNIGDKIIMKALAKMLSKKTNKTSEELGCEQSISHSYNISSKEYISPLMESISSS